MRSKFNQHNILHKNFRRSQSLKPSTHSASKRPILFFTVLIIFIISLILRSTDSVSTENESNFSIHVLSFVFPSVALVFYSLSHIDLLIRKRNFQFPRLNTTLNLIAGSLFIASLISVHTNNMHEALSTNLAHNWITAITFQSDSLFILLTFVLIIDDWFWKVLIPVSYYIGTVIAHIKADSPSLEWIILKNIFGLIFCCGLLYIQAFYNRKNINKITDLEEWGLVYKEILDKNPSAISVLDIEGKLIYSNAKFKKLSRGNEKSLFDSVTSLKVRSLYGGFLAQSKSGLFPIHSPGSPLNSEESFVRPMPTIGRKKLSTKESRRMTFFTYQDLTALLDHYRNLLITGRLDQEDQLIFDGKFNMKEFVSSPKSPKSKFSFPGDKEKNKDKGVNYVTLSYEVILRPLPENKKLIVILNDTTSRDLIATLENDSEYKDKVLASVSHELRTPLNGNLGFLQAALDEESVSIYVKKKYLWNAWRTGKILLHVIDDILDYSEAKTEGIRLKYEDLPIKDTLNYCYELYEQSFKAKGLKLCQEIHADLSAVFRTDHQRLKQIVLSLLSNALKFTMNGAVLIKAHPVEDSKVEIRIQDTGVGIKKEEVSNYLEKGEGETKGIGLGLMIAQTLAKLLNDDEGIHVSSELGKGSTFLFQVKPGEAEDSIATSVMSSERSQEEKQNQNQQTSAVSATSLIGTITSQVDIPHEHINGSQFAFGPTQDYFKVKKGLGFLRIGNGGLNGLQSNKRALTERQKTKRVLIVDDDSMNILVLETFLNQLHVPSDSAINGKEALNQITLRPNDYGLILMDCQMPVMDGFVATKALTRKMLKGDLPKIPIVGCTAFNSQAKLNECQKSGMVAVIAKPVMKARLVEILKKYLEADFE